MVAKHLIRLFKRRSTKGKKKKLTKTTITEEFWGGRGVVLFANSPGRAGVYRIHMSLGTDECSGQAVKEVFFFFSYLSPVPPSPSLFILNPQTMVCPRSWVAYLFLFFYYFLYIELHTVWCV